MVSLNSKYWLLPCFTENVCAFCGHPAMLSASGVQRNPKLITASGMFNYCLDEKKIMFIKAKLFTEAFHLPSIERVNYKYFPQI